MWEENVFCSTRLLSLKWVLLHFICHVKAALHHVCIVTSLQTWVWIHRAASWGLGTTLWGHDPARSTSHSHLHAQTQSIHGETHPRRISTTVYPISNLPIPLYFGGLALSSSCSWVLTYSVGKVMQISIPPAMPPAWWDGRGGKTKPWQKILDLCRNIFTRNSPWFVLVQTWNRSAAGWAPPTHPSISVIRLNACVRWLHSSGCIDPVRTAECLTSQILVSIFRLFYALVVIKKKKCAMAFPCTNPCNCIL